MIKKSKTMPAPKPEECGCDLIKPDGKRTSTKIEMHVDMARRIVGLKKLAGDTCVQYLRFCIGREYTMPDDEDAYDILDKMIQERKEAVQKHIKNSGIRSNAGKKSGEARRNKKQTHSEQKGTHVQFCSTNCEQKRTRLSISNTPSLPSSQSSTSVPVMPQTPGNGNGDSDLGTLEDRTEEFRRAFGADHDAVFDFNYDVVAICRAITGDTHSDRCWLKMVRTKGEEAVRATVRDCWAEWRDCGEPNNKGAVLQSKLNGLPDVQNGGKEVA